MKTTWMLSLIIGISLMVSCGDEITELPIISATYIYKNTLPETIQLNVKNHYNSSSFLINSQDSVRIDEKGELPNPFHGESIGNVIGDTVSISFGENKCTVYFKDFSSGTFGGNGVFNLEEYDNYTKELVNQRSYTLRYSIDSADYKKATTCK